MLDGRYTPEQLIRELRGFGLDLFVGEDGVVHGRFREKGKKMTLAMRAVAEELTGMNDEVAALLQAEEVDSAEGHGTADGRREYVGVTVDEAMALGEKIRAGELELDGVVTYHKGTGLCDLAVKGRANG